MRADFMQEQPSVKVVDYSNKLYIFIAVNGEWVERQVENHSGESEEPITEKVWECDYREIITTADKIDLDDVKANPANYLEWVEPKDESPTRTELNDIEAALIELADYYAEITVRQEEQDAALIELAALTD